MTDREEAILKILKQEIRLVACDNGERCERCGEDLDYTYKVKDGCLERIAELIAEATKLKIKHVPRPPFVIADD